MNEYVYMCVAVPVFVKVEIVTVHVGVLCLPNSSFASESPGMPHILAFGSRPRKGCVKERG